MWTSYISVSQSAQQTDPKLWIENKYIRKPFRKHEIMKMPSIYTKYFCFPIEMASSAGELKVLLMHVVNVGPWQVLPNNSSSLQHMSLVTPFQQLISPAGQLGGAQKTIVMASVLFSSKNKMKITPDQTAKVNTYSVIYMPHKEVPKTIWAHPFTDTLSPATAHTAHWRGPIAI